MIEAKWPSEIDVHVACDILAKKIKKALDKSCKVKDNMNYFISEETSKLIKLKRQIRRIAQKIQDLEHKRLANQLNIIIAKAVKNDKDTWWQKKHKKTLTRPKTYKML